MCMRDREVAKCACRIVSRATTEEAECALKQIGARVLFLGHANSFARASLDLKQGSHFKAYLSLQSRFVGLNSAP